MALANRFDILIIGGGPAGSAIITRQKKGWFWQIPINEDTTSIDYSHM